MSKDWSLMRKAPLLVRIFCYLFIFMGAVALLALVNAPLFPNKSSDPDSAVMFLTIRVTSTGHPILYITTLLFFVFSGITGLAVITKRSYAYDLGIMYCLLGLVYFSSLSIFQLGLATSLVMSLLVQFIFFGVFLNHLLGHRSQWKNG